MELDDLKSIWGSIKEEKKFDQNQIFKMLKKKSSTTIKWLFIFTLCEFFVFLGFNLYILISGKNFFNNDINSLVQANTINNYEIASVFSIIITVGFLIIAYKFYKKINLNQSVVELMKNIIAFRRLVNLFIVFTILSLIASSAPFYYEMGQSIYIAKHANDLKPIVENASIYGWIAILTSVMFIVIIGLIYYAVIYLLFLKKLQQNLKELREIK
ncbi:hypothetical protein SAMN05443634_10549 [Chishuiella changwenlii]|uniref:Uncharacterized protein n=1 Tax=Chishuiella changwenlii TaxID=1434701 RepID=A0A1M6WZT2_9FLAO|nr:hypothetical protein [Chishuiella changwenlii]GGE98639.1 hypothetical protein GCM10010984_15280 [Chishuiella changwenlii]SHK99085.1 hypothetical protein SAMN05443634_10549 [Chishuiella changwenlii]